MWQKFKKSAGRKPTDRPWLTSEMKVVAWCLNNNISISCMPDWENSGTKWLIDIKINRNTHRDPNVYEDEDVLNKIYEYYKYYYDKNKK